MFVFKAAVVGAGTMGGQIAQTIAAAGHPRRAQGHPAGVRRRRPDRGPQRSPRARSRAWSRRASSPRSRPTPQVEEVLGRIHGTTTYDGFGDVDFVIEAVPERMEIKQAVFAELDAVTPGHAILASNTSSLSITEIGEATLRPDKVVRLPLLLPGVGHAADRGRRGRRHLRPRPSQAAVNFAQAIKKQPITCARGPGLRRQPDPQLGASARSGARRRSAGCRSRSIDEARRRGRTSRRWGRSSSSTCSASTPSCTSPSTSTSPTATASTSTRACSELVARRQARREDRRRRLLRATASRSSPGDGEPDGEELAELLTLKSFVEACLRARGGRRHASATSTSGMMAGAGHGPAPRAAAAVHAGRRHRPRRRARAARGAPRSEHGERFAPPTILRRLVAQGRLGTKSGQGFYAYPQPDDGEQRRRPVKLETRGDVAIAWLANGR